MSTIVVTGGAGFLGSHLCERLLDRGDDVICVDNFFSGRKENIAHLIGNPRFELIRHDIVASAVCRVRADLQPGLPRLAGGLSVQPDQDDQDLDRRHGQRARPGQTLPGAAPAHLAPPKSTAIPTSIRRREDYWGHVNPIGPRSCYDEGKRVAESLCMNYHLAHGVAVRIVRIFNTYGPRMDPNDGRVVSNFIMQALRGEPLPSTATASRPGRSATSTT